ncbi:hypothetical protein [Sedimenticola selenatireducens]|uniref:DUF3311 domain-containing protein n=1 Tax=Sedimenticola selenatireducens TaxID=191960 RepID=A0A558DTP7_9GAMM|nr:hypothetical protein [Sedimenticola selenatireducens]TVO76943.1 hypothetical protein FHP88_05835 [Sedimenticola selenatireducens]TVT64386.1 MAG: hypothetical protein FHK78_09080 [Sedimenticola selenatireducens]
MRRLILTSQRLAAVFFVGMLLLFSPIVTLFDRPELWFGIPLLYLYLFSVWVLLIASMAFVIGGRK